ncbi:MAG TPA: peptidylprolyl isomerase [Candidatus Binatia bacterium]|nr:peptidylprolyl isomerase [Candidatus Binatia bacterium]
MKRFFPVVLAVVLGASLLLAQAGAGSSDSVVEEIIARVNNSIITRADVRKAREQLFAEAHQQPDTATAEQQAREHEKDLLRDLIDQQLLLQKAQDLGITADTELVKKLDELRKQMHADSMEDLEKAAEAQGVSFEDFKQNLKNNILTQRVIGQEVGGHIAVSNQEIQQYYDQHKSQMERPEQVRLSEILISTQTTPAVKNEKGETALPDTPAPEVVAQAQAKAQQVYEMLMKGGNFEDLAKKYSNGPTSAIGGDLEYFKRGTLSKQLESKVFELQAGQYTEPVRTNQGFVILKVTEHQNAGVPPLKEVENQIQEQVYMTKMQPALRDYLTKLREEAYIDIKPGYLDTGASPNETKPIYTTSASPSAPGKEKKKKKLGLF